MTFSEWPVWERAHRAGAMSTPLVMILDCSNAALTSCIVLNSLQLPSHKLN